MLWRNSPSAEIGTLSPRDLRRNGYDLPASENGLHRRNRYAASFGLTQKRVRIVRNCKCALPQKRVRLGIEIHAEMGTPGHHHLNFREARGFLSARRTCFCELARRNGYTNRQPDRITLRFRRNGYGFCHTASRVRADGHAWKDACRRPVFRASCASLAPAS